MNFKALTQKPEMKSMRARELDKPKNISDVLAPRITFAGSELTAHVKRLSVNRIIRQEMDASAMCHNVIMTGVAMFIQIDNLQGGQAVLPLPNEINIVVDDVRLEHVLLIRTDDSVVHVVLERMIEDEVDEDSHS